MQLPETPPPPLAPLWDRVQRAQALPPDLDVQLLYVAIRDRLTHPEWEVRLHALRVLADLLPLSGNALSFPFDQVVDNLGHNSPNVRKAALDALKVFCTHCEDPECAARAFLDKCSYNNIRPHSANIDTKVNVITGLILSIPSVMSILKRRNPALDMFPIFQALGDKLFDPVHYDVAQRALLKLRRACGARDYMVSLSRLDPKVQDKFRFLCETYDEDSMDVYYAPRKTSYRNNNQPLVQINHVFNSPFTGPIRLSTDSSSEESFRHMPIYNNNFAKVIIETEIKFDSDTAITMTVLEENETESEKYTGSEDDYDSSDRNMLKYSDGDSEDTDVVVKKVRFGGESVKIRTPDSDNIITSEDDHNKNKVSFKEDNINEVSKPMTPVILNKVNEIKREAPKNNNQPIQPKSVKRSGIPLPVINHKTKQSHKHNIVGKYSGVKLKSKSLSELYDYFRTKNDDGKKEVTGFTLSLSGVRSPDKLPSPVEHHKEVEVLHNLQRSPVVSPRPRRQTRVHLERDGFVLNLLASSPHDSELLSPRPPTPVQPHYDWEDLGIAPTHLIEQLHNTENWISSVKATDQLHSALLDPGVVRRVEPAALSLVQHMWALSEAVSAARAPAEGAVCAIVRGSSNDCLRSLLPRLVARMAREPPPTALPHALLQRIALHHLVDLIFVQEVIGVSGDEESVQSAQLLATLCLARAAGPAAVLSAVRRRLAGTARADHFCHKLRERLSRPVENVRPGYIARSSHLPVPVRRRARSTPPPAAPLPPRRLRPLPDSAPLPGVSQINRDFIVRPLLSPIPLSDSEGRRAAAGVSRGGASLAAGGMLRCCCPPRPVAPAPRASFPLDLVADLPPHARDSSAFTSFEDKDAPHKEPFEEQIYTEETIFGHTTEVDIPDDDGDEPAPPRSPSMRVEDFSEKSHRSLDSVISRPETALARSKSPSLRKSPSLGTLGSQRSPKANSVESLISRAPSRGPSPTPSKSRSAPSTPARSARQSPDAVSDAYEERPPPNSRDVRAALAECNVSARHDDWEVIVRGLVETERLAGERGARAPAASWRTAARSAAGHVRSLRSRVARAACGALGALFENRGRALEPELEEAAGALLERCADVNRFLRADAAGALGRVACGCGGARAAVALARRGAGHRAGPVRAAAAAALARLVQRAGPRRVLDLSPEPRGLVLRAAGDLLADANAEARSHARLLCLALSEDPRFPQMLKEAMPASRYRAIEKSVDKLQCR